MSSVFDWILFRISASVLYPEQSRNLGPAAVLRSESNYFDDDFRHHRSERDRRIDLQALQENFQAPEVVKWCIWCIVTR